MHSKTYAVVDLETTGHSSTNGDRIIQVAIVLIQNGVIGEPYMRFVNPGQKIPYFIQNLTDISDEDVAHAPPFEKIAQEVRDLLEGAVFVAHNTDFDLSFLQREFTRCGVSKWQGQKIDTVELAKIVFPTLPSYRLQDIASSLHIALPSAHRADDDAVATSNLFLACLAKLEQLPVETLTLLHRRSFYCKSDLSSVFYAVLKKLQKKNTTQHFIEYKGIPLRNFQITGERSHKTLAYPFEDHEKTNYLQKAFPNFEMREAQYRFMDAVWDVLQSRGELVAEAPTGIGKTIGYLLPATIFSLAQGKPVVISTYTNHLADKIYSDELEKLRSLLEVNVQATIIKGMNHYISLGKLEELLRIADESYDETFTIMQILVWLMETETGDLDELNVSGGGQLFLDRIRKRTGQLSELENQVDYHQRLIEQCSSSHIIITNHSMLLTDGHRNDRIFDLLGGLIVDEAHQFVQTANRLEERVFSFTNWKYTMGQVGSDAEGQLFYQLAEMGKRVNAYSEYIFSQCTEAFSKFSQCFDEAIDVLITYKPTEPTKYHGNRKVFSLTTAVYEKDEFSQVAATLFDYTEAADNITKSFTPVFDQMTQSEQAILSEWDYWVNELKVKMGEWIEIFLESAENQFTAWIEKDQRSIPGSIQVVKYPLDGSTATKSFIERIKDGKTGIVWTSGTLSVPKHARFIPNQLGIDESVPIQTFHPPQNFYEGAEIFIIEDMPDIQQVSQSKYIEAVANAVVQTVLATGGRLFVLFTAQEMLRKTFEIIVDSEQLEEYTLFAQGITSGSRMKILKSFRQFDNSVLFGTNSFWEGVDVPGDALTSIMIVRLPFSSPDEPVYKAKAEKLAAQGMNPFSEYALPDAILRLRQGFGRLIRSSTDRGHFIILDRRIDTKSYGDQFIESLPNVPIKKVKLEVMVNELENCYNRVE